MRSVLQQRLVGLAVALAAVLAPTVITTAGPAQGATYAVSATWVSTPHGATLSVVPTGYAQGVGTWATTGLMNNAHRLAGMRPYNPYVQRSLSDQAWCHLYFRLKTPYNLDTWRPVVPKATLLKTLCNPGPP